MKASRNNALRKPDAGNPPVRFDEGEGSRRSLPLCSHPVASFSTLLRISSVMPCSEKFGSKCSSFSDSRIEVSSLPMPENTKPLPGSKVGIPRMKEAPEKTCQTLRQQIFFEVKSLAPMSQSCPRKARCYKLGGVHSSCKQQAAQLYLSVPFFLAILPFALVSSASTSARACGE